MGTDSATLRPRGQPQWKCFRAASALKTIQGSVEPYPDIGVHSREYRITPSDVGPRSLGRQMRKRVNPLYQILNSRNGRLFTKLFQHSDMTRKAAGQLKHNTMGHFLPRKGQGCTETYGNLLYRRRSYWLFGSVSQLSPRFRPLDR